LRRIAQGCGISRIGRSNLGYRIDSDGPVRRNLLRLAVGIAAAV